MKPSRRALEATIYLLLQVAAVQRVQLTRMKVVKLLYFLDLKAWEELGAAVTGVDWQWHNYGPYSAAVVDACKDMAVDGRISEEHTYKAFGQPEFRHRPHRLAEGPKPSAALASLVRAVVAEYGKCTPSEIKRMSYDTQPMRQVVAGGHHGDTLEFTARPPTSRAIQRVISRYTVRALETEGCDQGDLSAGLREDVLYLADARTSATQRLLDEY